MEMKTCCLGSRMLWIGTVIFVIITAVSSCLFLYCSISDPLGSKHTKKISGHDSGSRYEGTEPIQEESSAAVPIMYELIVLASCVMAGYSMLKNRRVFFLPFMIISIVTFGILLVTCYAFNSIVWVRELENSFFPSSLITFGRVILVTCSFVVIVIYLHFLVIAWSSFAATGNLTSMFRCT